MTHPFKLKRGVRVRYLLSNGTGFSGVSNQFRAEDIPNGKMRIWDRQQGSQIPYPSRGWFEIEIRARSKCRETLYATIRLPRRTQAPPSRRPAVTQTAIERRSILR